MTPATSLSSCPGRRCSPALLTALLALAAASCGDQLIDTRPPPPQLSEASLATLSLREDTAPGTALRTFTVADPGPYVPLALSYRLIPNADTKYFAVSRSDGELRLEESLDYEAQSRYELPVRVNHHSSYTDGLLVITIVDVHEELAPLASAQEPAPAEIAPDDRTGRVIADISTMVTKQAGAAASYALAAGSDSGLFTIDEQSGELSLANPVAAFAAANSPITVGVLVRRDGKEIEIQVPVHTANVLYFADPGTRAPLAPDARMKLSLMENGGTGASVGRLLALQSRPGEVVSYALSHPLFAVDPASGAITATESLDYEAGPRRYSFEANAAAGALRARLMVEVDVSDANDPPTPPAVVGSASDGGECGCPGAICLSVDENTVPSEPLAMLSSDDEDGDSVSLALVTSQLSSSFMLDANGALRLIEAQNREQFSHADLQIVASDGNGGNVQRCVVVTFNDVNEAPEWTSPGRVEVSEAESAGHTVVDLSSASDPEGRSLSYAIAPANPDGLFEISGASLALASALDYESADTHSLTLRISDPHGLFADFPLAIAVGNVDEPPALAEAALSAPENSPAGTAAGRVLALDPENGAVSYAVDAGSPVAVDPATGAATLARVFDHESEPSIAFTLVLSDATGNSVNAPATLTVANVDETPVFVAPPAGNAVDVVKSLGAGAVVATLRAEDPEGANISYSLGAGSSGGHFAIDSAGVLTLAGSPAASSAALPSSLEVIASDGSLSAKLVLALRPIETLLAPRLSGNHWEVAEDLAVGSEIATLSIVEPGDPVVSVSVFDGSSRSPSARFAANGERIVLTDALDYEGASAHSLIVRLMTANDSFDYQATVSVTDVDEPPAFAQPSAELTRRVGELVFGSSLGTWTAVDPEGRAVSYAFTGSGAARALFGIDAASGALSLAGRPALFDGEITIEAADSAGNTTQLTLSLILRDNAAPEIVTEKEVYVVLEDGPANEVILSLSATDPDDDPISWRIAPSDEAGSRTDSGAELQFSVSQEGELIAITPLDYEAPRRSHWLTIVASDGLEQDSAHILVAARDRNDLPQITVGLHAGQEIFENARRGAIIRRFAGVDQDRGHSRLKWSVSGISGMGQDCPPENDQRLRDLLRSDIPDFIDGGVLRLRTAFNHEECEELSITVRVTDRADGYTEGSFTISILDVNDPPELEMKDQYYIPEGEAARRTLFDSLTISDPDGGPYGIYLDFPGPGQGFEFDSQAKSLVSTTPLDHESKASYPIHLLSTICTDPNDLSLCPPGSGKIHTTTICVLDVNERPRLHLADDAMIPISEQARVNAAIYDGFEVSDPDGHPVQLRISAGNGDGLFSIDRQALILNAALTDAEKSHHLTIEACDVVGEEPEPEPDCPERARVPPYEPLCHSQTLSISVTDDDIEPPALPSNIKVKEKEGKISISWDDPDDSDYEHTLLSWRASGGAIVKRTFNKSMHSVNGHDHFWQSGNEDPALTFGEGLNRFEMVSVDESGNSSAPVRLRVRIVEDVKLPILMRPNIKLVDLHLHDETLDRGDSINDYAYTIMSGNDSWKFHHSTQVDVVQTHFRFRTASDTIGKFAQPCPPGWLCTHKPLLHHFDPGTMPDTYTNDRSGNHGYTFARTKSDELVVRLQHRHYSYDIDVRVSPNAHAEKINRRCKGIEGLSRFKRWLCVNGRELLPQGMSRQLPPTRDEICALPEVIRRTWGNDRNSYQLAMAADFNSINDVERIFETYTQHEDYWLEANKEPHTVEDGAWSLSFDPVVNDFDSRRLGQYEVAAPGAQSLGRFEFSSGYFEVRQLNDIPYLDVTGPFMIFWSRYGEGHDNFGALPDRTVFDDQLTASSGAPVDLDSVDPAPGPYQLHRSVIGKVGFLEIDFWERWLLNQTGPLWVVHSYPRNRNARRETVKHGQSYTVRGDQAWGENRNFLPLPTSGPFVTGLEINPDSSSLFDAIRFFRKLDSEPAVAEVEPVGLAKDFVHANFRDVVSHTAPMWINLALVRPRYESYRQPCFSENFEASGTREIRCADPLVYLEPGDLKWKFDYFRLWKRRGYDIDRELTGKTAPRPTPVPFTCP